MPGGPGTEGPEARGVLATGSGDSGEQTLDRESVARALLLLKAWSGQQVGKHKKQAKEERISELLGDPPKGTHGNKEGGGDPAIAGLS